MKSFWFSFFWVILANLNFSNAISPSDAREPLVRLVLISYFDQSLIPEEDRKIDALFNQLETAILSERRTRIRSLDEYIFYRNSTPTTVAEYRDQIQKRGLINPLTITAPNTKVFESIVEYEVRQTQQLINSLSATKDSSLEVRMAIDSAQSMIATYNLGLSLRNGLDEATRSWQGLPVLGFLRSMGENVINPAVRATIYSEPLMNRMRAELHRHFSIARQKLKHGLPQFKTEMRRQGLSQFELEWSSMISEMDFLKPLKDAQPGVVFDFIISFFQSLPEPMKQDIVWYWINHPESFHTIKGSPNQVISFFKNQHPHSEELFRRLNLWLQSPTVKAEIQKLSRLPVWELTQSLVQLMRQDLQDASRTGSEDQVKFRLLGDFAQRNWLGNQRNRFQILLVSETQDSDAEMTMSLAEFLEKNPGAGLFLKKKIAQVTLHNAFQFGLRSIISAEVRIRRTNQANEFEVLIPQLGARQNRPTDQTERFIATLAELPLGELMNSQGRTSDPLMLFGSLSPRAQSDVSQFLAEPENVRWAIQLFQLRDIVGEDILRSELKSYMLWHPKIVGSFIKKKWLSRKSKLTSRDKLSQCQMFYSGSN